MEENEISHAIIGASMQVHRALGPGLLENAYKECLYYQISNLGLYVEKEKPMPLYFEGVRLDCGYRLDLLVERKVVVELKSVEALCKVHYAQTLTYMRLGKFKLGLLINFNVAQLKEGVKRLVNGMPPEGSYKS